MDAVKASNAAICRPDLNAKTRLETLETKKKKKKKFVVRKFEIFKYVNAFTHSNLIVVMRSILHKSEINQGF